MPGGKVKFYDPDKGFGFITPDDGQEDLFVYVSALRASGLTLISAGDQLEFDVERDERSGRFTATELDLIAAAPAPAPRAGLRARARSEPTPGGVERGVVKWFNATKGFGFISPSAGGADIFVHISAVERAGLAGLTEGQALSYSVERDRRTGKVSATGLEIS